MYPTFNYHVVGFSGILSFVPYIGSAIACTEHVEAVAPSGMHVSIKCDERGIVKVGLSKLAAATHQG